MPDPFWPEHVRTRRARPNPFARAWPWLVIGWFIGALAYIAYDYDQTIGALWLAWLVILLGCTLLSVIYERRNH